CFSRNQGKILPDVYSDETPPVLGAQIVLAEGNGKETTFQFDGIAQNQQLKRIAVFDSTVARTHLVEQNPLGFKPAGFDVFPEMARVYTKLAEQLNADIQVRTKVNPYPRSFLEQSRVSQFVTALSAQTDLAALRALATFGDGEAARLHEV